MTLYICCSHLYIPTVLTLYEKNGEDACFFTDKINIVEMLKYRKETMSVYCSQPRGCLFLNVFREKKNLKAWLRDKDINNVFFFHEGYCDIANWMMLYLSRSPAVEFHYVPIARSYLLNGVDIEKGMRTQLKAAYCRLLWGYKPIYPSVDKNCGIMPQAFYDKLRIKTEETVEINKDLGKTILPNDFDENGIVLLDNPNLSDLESEKEYKSFLETALKPILDDCPIYFKNHPGRTRKIGLENDIKEIPSFISGNLLTHRFRAFVGVNSALLCEAANDGTTAISLAYLVKLDESDRENIVSYHRLLSDKVLFPKTIEELWSLLLLIQ